MAIKLDVALKGRAVNVNDEKLTIKRLDRANSAYILEDGTSVPADELQKKGRGLFFTPARKKAPASGRKPAGTSERPAARQRAATVETEAATIDRELKGKMITINQGKRDESKQRIVAIVKGVGYKVEDGTVVEAGQVFKKGRGVFANIKSAAAAPKKRRQVVDDEEETTSAKPVKKTTSGLKPKAATLKPKEKTGGLAPKAKVARRGEAEETETVEAKARKRVKQFTQDIAERLETSLEKQIQLCIQKGKLDNLDLKLVALAVDFEPRRLILEAGFVPANATEKEINSFVAEVFEDNGGADTDLTTDELDEELEEELDEEMEVEEDDEEEELDDEEQDEDDEEELEEDDELDDEEEVEEDDEEEVEEEEDFDDEEEQEEDDEEDDDEEDDELEDEDDFDDEEEQEEDDEEEEDLETLDDDEEEEETIDLELISRKSGLNMTAVEKYATLLNDANFDLGVDIGSRVKDSRNGESYYLIGSTTKKDSDAKIVVTKKNTDKAVAVTLDRFTKYFSKI